MIKKNGLIAAACVTVALCTMFFTNASAAESPVEYDAHDIKSNYGLLRYVSSTNEVVNDVAVQNAEKVAATITLSDYISFEDVAEYIEKYDLDAGALYIRSLDSQGDRITTYTMTSLGIDKTKAIVMDEATAEGFDVIGVVAIEAVVSGDKIENMKEDPNTYLIDVATTSNEQDVAIVRSGEINEEYRYSSPLTWQLEDLGILRYAK